MSAAIEVPAVVRNKPASAGASAWLDELSDLVESIERRWGLAIGRTFDDATEAFVAAATILEHGTPVVLKIVVPRAGNAAESEIAVLRRAGGEGCVELLRSDESIGTLLLERRGPSLSELALPIGRRHEILCDVVMRLWRTAPDLGLTTGAAKARWLAERIAISWEELDRPCSEHAVAHAIACARRRECAHDDERAVLVHGDVHQWNALRSDSGEFKLVDPDGLLAEAGTTSASSCARTPSSWSPATRGNDRTDWPPTPVATQPRSGSGVWSNGSRPACSPPRSSSNRSARICSAPPNTWPRWRPELGPSDPPRGGFTSGKRDLEQVQGQRDEAVVADQGDELHQADVAEQCAGRRVGVVVDPPIDEQL
jgi:streptomycin 6-kinase